VRAAGVNSSSNSEGPPNAIDDLVGSIFQLQPCNEQDSPPARCQLADAATMPFPCRPTVVPSVAVGFNNKSVIGIREINPSLADRHLANGQGQTCSFECTQQ
jgi:hypothetical protein